MSFFKLFLLLLSIGELLCTPSLSFAQGHCSPLFQNLTYSNSPAVKYASKASQSLFLFGKEQGIKLEQDPWNTKINQILQNKKRFNWLIKLGQLTDYTHRVFKNSTQNNSKSPGVEALIQFTNIQITFFLTSETRGIEPNLVAVFELHTQSFESVVNDLLISGFRHNEFNPTTQTLNKIIKFNRDFSELAHLSWKLQSTPRAIQRIYRDKGLEQILTKSGFMLYMDISQGYTNHRSLLHYLRHWDFLSLRFPLEVTSAIESRFPTLKDHRADLVFLDTDRHPIVSIQYTSAPTGLHGVLRSYSKDQKTQYSAAFVAPEISRFYHHFSFDNKIYIWSGQHELIAYDMRTLEIVTSRPMPYVTDVYAKDGHLFILTQSDDLSHYELAIWNSDLSQKIISLEIPPGNDKPLIEIHGKDLYVEYFGGGFTNRVLTYDLKSLLAGQINITSQYSPLSGPSHHKKALKATPPWRKALNFIKSILHH